MLAVLLGTIAGIGFGAYTVLVRLPIRTGPVPMAAAIVAVAIAIVVVGALAVASGQLGRANATALALIGLTGFLVPGVSQYAFLGAVAAAGPARAAVLIGLAPFMSAAIAIAFLGEPLRPAVVGGTLLIVGGCALLAWEGQTERPEGFRTIGLVLAAFCAVLFALRDVALRLIAEHHHAPPFPATLAALACGLCSLAGVESIRTGGVLRSAAGYARPYLPAGLALAVGYAGIVWALDVGRVTIVSPLNAGQSLWAVFFSVLLLGRADRVGPRLVTAGVLVVLGGALIAVGRG
jgi:drug/metabolite transporter (DMT)-like permease